ncbi:MAG TPA: cytochrome c-type biogenesis protein CcmH [Candidatus Nitrosocosmicus sp.]|nr:cytochrome c-type biogenesis protein CcmH [Candidatus Nitrosocosmicus sp.]
MTRLRLARALLLAVAALAALGAAPPGRAVTEDQVREVAANLRCVVCQSLSVADSPSETANQMRAIVRERLAAGETPEQVTAYFVEKYGTWILLAPPRRGFDLLVWVVPFMALALGLGLAILAMRRWRRRSAAAAPPAAVDDATRARIRREMAELDS